MKNNYIIVTGGGTGGHLSVAKTLIDEFYKRNYKIIFIGSTNGADKAWFENYKKIEKRFFFNTRGVVNQNLFGKLKSIFLIFKAFINSIQIIYKYKVKKIVSVGGFSAAPASIAAIVSKKDFYIHEQNSIMGKLNKITAKYAKDIFSSYDKNATIKDYPINQEFFKYARVREKIKTIIFLGGSQGATAINNFALKVAPILKEKNINIIHQCGKYDYQRIKDSYKKMQIDVELFDFSNNILKYMDKADFAISRSGASTLWELCAIGLPALYIPYPYAAANHQFYNAKFLFDQNLCFLKTQDQLKSDTLDEILNDDIKTKSSKLIKLIKKDGAKLIVDKILDD